jgi:regulator of replication initiation timing
MSDLLNNINILHGKIDELIKKYNKLKTQPLNDDLIKENERLKNEIKKLQNASSSVDAKKNIIIVKQQHPQNYENDGRFSDYVFRNPKRRNEGVNESVEDFIKKNF